MSIESANFQQPQESTKDDELRTKLHSNQNPSQPQNSTATSDLSTDTINPTHASIQSTLRPEGALKQQLEEERERRRKRLH